MKFEKPTAETSTKALANANRVLLRCIAREKRTRLAHHAAADDLAKAKRGLALLIAAISQP